MRCFEVRDAIISKMEAIVPDEKAHSGDVFRSQPPGIDASLVDREVTVLRTVPQEPADRLFAGADPYAVMFEVIVSYLPAPGMQKRILQDGDLIVDTLKDLPATEVQIHNIELNGGSDLDDEAGNRAATWTIRVFYDRRDP